MKLPALLAALAGGAIQASPGSATELWEARGAVPGGIICWSAVLVGDRILVFASDASSNLTYEFVPGATAAQDAWIARAPRPAPLLSYEKAGVIGGLVYLPGGGTGSNNSTNELAIYDPALDSWSLGPTLPREVNNYALAVLDQRLYLSGGCCSNRSELFTFDPALGWATESASLPLARVSPAGAPAAGQFFVIAGYDWPGTTRLDNVDVYDPALSAWSAWPPIPSEREGHGAVACGDRIYVVGGAQDGKILDSLEILDVAGRSWSTGPVMPAPAGAMAAVLRRGKIWVFPATGGNVMLLHTEDPPAAIPPDQGNVLLAVKSGTDVVLDFRNAPAGAWRVHRDVVKTAIGTTPLAPDAGQPGFRDFGVVPDLLPYHYAVKGLSPCSLTPGP